jgi:hypothetical protein
MDARTSSPAANPGDTASMLERRYPHIVQGLVQAWLDPEAADHFLGALLVDDRDGRQGLPDEVFEELMFISDLNWKRRHFSEDGVQISPDRFGFGPL